MKHTQYELSKHARKAIKKGRRRDSKCDRRTAQRDLRSIVSIISEGNGVLSGKVLAERVLDDERCHGIAITNKEGRVL